MNLISQIFLAILTTMATGMLSIGIWLAISRICIRCHPRLPYLLLRIICLLHILPISYICMQLSVRDGYIQVASPWQINFAPTGILWKLFLILLIGWIFLTGRQLYAGLLRLKKKKEFEYYNMPEDNEEILAELARIKEKLHIHRKVRLYRNSRIKSPGTYGVFRCKIVLPTKNFSKKQLVVIFYHELMHCKSFDIFYKYCVRYIALYCHIGIIIRWLDRMLAEWSEYNCDIRAVDAMKSELNLACYFEMILESMRDTAGKQDENHIFSGLCESRYRLERRIEYMRKYGKVKITVGKVAAMMTLAFALTSVTTVYAAGNGMAEVYDKLYQNVEVKAAETRPSQNLKEFYIPAAMDKSYEKIEYANPEAEFIMPAIKEDEITSFNWEVTPGVRKVSTSFYVKKGQVISMSTTVSPTSSTFWIGIMDGLNSVRYVEGTGSLSHNFEITKSGRYRVLVQNRGNETLTAAGSYVLSTP